MNKLLLSILALGAVACQQSSKPSSQAVVAAVPGAPLLAVAVATPDTTLAAPDTTRATAEPEAEVELKRQPLRAAAATALLARYNLADFWKGKAFESETTPMDGFFGNDYRRIGFAFTAVRRDSLRPEVFHVAGKTRYFKTITPFVGEVRISSVARLKPKHGEFDVRWGLLDVDSLCRVYSAKASFTFREDSTVTGAGSFAGTAHLDFYLDAQRQLQLAQAMGKLNNMPALGTGLLYRGRWASYRGNLSRPLLLSRDVFAVAPAALTNFRLGERDPVFNPKYAKLGWNTYWENDEWWADSPKPKLNL